MDFVDFISILGQKIKEKIPYRFLVEIEADLHL